VIPLALGRGLIGTIGSDLISSLSVNIDLLLTLHGVTMNGTRHNTSAASNIYGEPQDTPTQFTAVVLIVKQELEEEETMAGGKRKEVLTLMGQPGTLLENDIVAYSGHNYAVRHVGRSTVQSAVAAEVYIAVREVDV
jgi:hypothetical protein